jgi:hypothetical protein
MILYEYLRQTSDSSFTLAMTASADDKKRAQNSRRMSVKIEHDDFIAKTSKKG